MMDQDRTVKKILFGIVQGDISMEQGLEQAYAAGYDERGMDLNSHKTRKVTQLTASGSKIKEYASIKTGCCYK